MKMKHNTATAFSIASATAFFVAAAVWATPQPKTGPVHAGCPGKTLTVETAGGGSGLGAGRAAP